MDFRLLGPLQVSSRASRSPSAASGNARRWRVLLLHANELVSTDRLIDELWGAAPPAMPKDRSGLRVEAAQGARSGHLATRRRATCSVEPEELDLARFELLAAEARHADQETAAAKLREALASRRGPALADLAYEAFAQVEIARLQEMRLTVLEQRIDADLALGPGTPELVGELEALVTRFPLREGLRGELMLALYRSDRQAEALDAYRAARQELAEELGLEPSEELKRSSRRSCATSLRLRRRAKRGAAADAAARVAREAEPCGARSAQRASGLDALLALAEPLASVSQPPREPIVAGVVPPQSSRAPRPCWAARRDRLLAAGVAARTAAFSSPSRGRRSHASRPRRTSTCCCSMPVPSCSAATQPRSSSRRRPTLRCSRSGRHAPRRPGDGALRRRQRRLGGAGARRLGRGRGRSAAAADRRGRSRQGQAATRAGCSPTRR